MLTLSTVFTTLLLTGATTSGLRKFYLLELEYERSGSLGRLADLAGSMGLPQDGGAQKFYSVRVGYRGTCILSSKDKDGKDQDWSCAADSAGGKPSNFSGDPLQLVDIAELYGKHISFSVPLWVALSLLITSWVATAISCVPVVPIPKATHKVAAGAAGLAVLALGGSMTLQHVTGGAVASIVRTMGMDAIKSKLGSMNQAIGWSAFALVILAAGGTTTVVVVEAIAEKAQAAAERKAEELVGVSAASSLRSGIAAATAGPTATGGGPGTGSLRGQGLTMATKVIKGGLDMARQKQTV